METPLKRKEKIEIMKKTTLLLVVLSILVCMCACGKKEAVTEPEPVEEQTESTALEVNEEDESSTDVAKTEYEPLELPTVEELELPEVEENLNVGTCPALKLSLTEEEIGNMNEDYARFYEILQLAAYDGKQYPSGLTWDIINSGQFDEQDIANSCIYALKTYMQPGIRLQQM